MYWYSHTHYFVHSDDFQYSHTYENNVDILGGA